MSQPTPYNKTTTFANETFDQDFKDALDIELHNVETAIDETQTNLALVQRDDGALRNGIVTKDSLSAGLYTEILSDIAGTDLSVVTAEVAGYAADAEAARDAAQDAQVIAEGYKNDAQGYATDAQGYAQDAQDAIDSLSQTTYEAVATAGQSQIIPGFTFDNAAGNIRVYIDGVIQPPSAYTLPNTTTIALSSALAGGEDILVFSVDFTAAPSTPLYVSNNLSDLSNVNAAIANLGLGDLAVADVASNAGLDLTGGALGVKVKSASGLNLDADGLWLDLGTDPGLEFSADGLEVKLASNSGLTKTSDGLAVSGGGEWEELTAKKVTASSSASVAFTGLDGTAYDYRVVLRDVKPGTNTVTMRVETGHGATPTYRAEDYTVAVTATNQAGTAGNFGSVNQSIAVITSSLTTANQSDRVHADMMFGWDNTDTAVMYGNAAIINNNGGGAPAQTVITQNMSMLNVSLGFTALRFTMSSGNIASGVFRIFRRAK